MKAESKCGPRCIVEYNDPKVGWVCFMYLDAAKTQPVVFGCPHEAAEYLRHSLIRHAIHVLLSGAELDQLPEPEAFRITGVDEVPEEIEVTSVDEACAVLNTIRRKI